MHIPQSKRSHALVAALVVASLVLGFTLGSLATSAARTPSKRFRAASTASAPSVAPRATRAAHPVILVARPSPHPKPVAARAAIPVPPAGSVAARVAKAWPGDDAWALRTVACESGFDPKQIGGGGNNYHGLFQMGPWARSHGYGEPLSQTIEQQVASAWRLIVDEGSTQWACSPWAYWPHRGA